MTFIGKIFTFLIAIISVVFLGLSISVVGTHKIWKEEVVSQPDGLRATVERLKSNIKDLEGKRLALKEEIERERVRRAYVIADLNSKNDDLSKIVEAAEGVKAQLQTERANAVANANAATAALVEANQANETLRDEIRVAQLDRDKEFRRVVELTDDIHAAEAAKSNQEERNKQLAREVASMKRVMDAKGLTINSLTDHIEPRVDGFITAVSIKNSDLVEISLGADDGMRPGHQLDVHRGGVYLGRIIVDETSPNRSVGRVVKELRRGQIKKNDRVTTKFG